MRNLEFEITMANIHPFKSREVDLILPYLEIIPKAFCRLDA